MGEGEGAAWGRGKREAGVLARWVLEPVTGSQRTAPQPPFSQDPERIPHFPTHPRH